MSEKTISRYPLDWPDGWKRTKHRTLGHFHKMETVHGENNYSWKRKKELSVYEAIQRVLDALDRMGVSEGNVIISSNVPTRLDGLPRSDMRAPSDPGVAVYWKKHNQPPMRCMAIDRYTHVEDNIAAIAATLEAMRAIERHGGAEILDRTFKGFAALPETASQPWRTVLEIDAEKVTRELIQQQFRRLSLLHHPDVGGDQEKFLMLTRARDAAYLEVLA